MGVYVDDRGETLFVSSVAAVCLRRRRPEWIPDYEPDLDWSNRPRNSSNPDPDCFDQLVLLVGNLIAGASRKLVAYDFPQGLCMGPLG